MVRSGDSNPSNKPVRQLNGGEGGNAVAKREVQSTELLAGERELLIRHAGETYTLRQTSKGKLILTK